MSGRVTKYDYDALERQYVSGTMSIRALCEANEIPTWSTVNEQAKRREWDKKRAAFQEMAQRKEMEVLTDKRAEKLEKLTDDVIGAIHAGVYRFLEGLQDRVVRGEDGVQFLVPGTQVTAADLTKLIDKVQLLRGQPTGREVHLGVNVSADLRESDIPGLPVDVLREIAAAARAAGAGTSTSGSSPIPSIEGPRKVN